MMSRPTQTSQFIQLVVASPVSITKMDIRKMVAVTFQRVAMSYGLTSNNWPRFNQASINVSALEYHP